MAVFMDFFQFRTEKKEFAVEMKTLHDFPYFFNAYQAFWRDFRLQQDSAACNLHVQSRQ